MKNTSKERPSAIKSSARIARRTGSQDCLVHGLRRESGNGYSRLDASSADRPDRSLLDDLRAWRDCDRPGAKTGRTRTNHFHLSARSRYLLTSVDLPIVSQIIEASEEAPCLAMSLKLEMPVIRELLSREEIQVA